jgi:hypothetical protein
MRKFLLLIAALGYMSPTGFAASLTIKFINQSSEAINSITAKPKSGEQPINLTTSPMAAFSKTAASLQISNPIMPAVILPSAQQLASAQNVSQAAQSVKPNLTPPIIPTPTAVTKPISDPSAVTLTAPDKTCVFAIIITFASGKVTTLTDTDLCQTDSIIIQ